MWSFQAHGLRLEAKVRRHGGERGARGEAIARRERPAEEIGGGFEPPQGHAAVGDSKKLTERVERRTEVRRRREELSISERRICELMEIPRMSYGYRSRRDDSGLRERLMKAKRRSRVISASVTMLDGTTGASTEGMLRVFR